MLIRLLGGVIGLALLAIPFLALVSGKEVPCNLWLGSLMGLTFFLYAIGGTRLFERIAPGWTSPVRPVKIEETSTGRRTVIVRDNTGKAYTFFRDAGEDLFFAEGDQSQALELDGTRVERFTRPRGVVVMFLHGLMRRGDFQFIDEHGQEWEIQGTHEELGALLALSRA